MSALLGGDDPRRGRPDRSAKRCSVLREVALENASKVGELDRRATALAWHLFRLADPDLSSAVAAQLGRVEADRDDGLKLIKDILADLQTQVPLERFEAIEAEVEEALRAPGDRERARIAAAGKVAIASN